MNTRDLEAFDYGDEPALSVVIMRFVRHHQRLPTGEELAAMWLPPGLTGRHRTARYRTSTRGTASMSLPQSGHG